MDMNRQTFEDGGSEYFLFLVLFPSFLPGISFICHETVENPHFAKCYFFNIYTANSSTKKRLKFGYKTHAFV